MEEKILEIINENVGTIRPTKNLKSANEITAHVFEFIEWLIVEEEIFMGELTERYITNRNIKQDITLPELYDYWLKNVKE